VINIEEMRDYIRYPSDISVSGRTEHGQPIDGAHMNNISGNGLCFTARTKVEPGNSIYLGIPLHLNQFEVKATVMWCMDMDSHYELGVKVELDSPETNARNFEILCDIEHYRQQVLEKEGRELSSIAAIGEWFDKFGKHTSA
jgi:hypothetical protein